MFGVDVTRTAPAFPVVYDAKEGVAEVCVGHYFKEDGQWGLTRAFFPIIPTRCCRCRSWVVLKVINGDSEEHVRVSKVAVEAFLLKIGSTEKVSNHDYAHFKLWIGIGYYLKRFDYGEVLADIDINTGFTEDRIKELSASNPEALACFREHCKVGERPDHKRVSKTKHKRSTTRPAQIEMITNPLRK